LDEQSGAELIKFKVKADRDRSTANAGRRQLFEPDLLPHVLRPYRRCSLRRDGGHVLEEAIKAVDDPAVECILGTTCGRRPKYCRAACRAAAHRRQRDGSPAFRAFTDRMRDRLALGEARYGNTTFAKSPGGRSYALALTVPPAVRRVEERLQLNDSLFLQSRKVLIGQSCQFLVNSIIVVADGD
jgi:hypothetical protein